MNKLNKVAIFGVGKSGKAALRLALRKEQEVIVVNKGDPEQWWEREGLRDLCSIEFCLSEDDFYQEIQKVDEIILSPGIPLSHPLLKRALNEQIPVISEIEYAWRHSKSIPVIAITGTNGKTTTATMLTQILQTLGKKVFCGGNIGLPYSELPLSDMDFDLAVIEVSSFQLEAIEEFHPVVGMILNLSPNHTERYESFSSYGDAKFRILKNMTIKDHMILGEENPFLDKIKDHPVQKIFFKKDKLPDSFTKTFDFSEAKVKGAHNEANFFVVHETLKILKIPFLSRFFQDFITDFNGVPHRLEYLGCYEGLQIYNDAKSTNFLATENALKAFMNISNKGLYLILGGKSRCKDDAFLATLLPFKGKITKIFLIGDVTDNLFDELKTDFTVVKAFDLKVALGYVKGLRGYLIFSPGHPSFDQFKNFEDRGNKFKAWVKEAY